MSTIAEDRVKSPTDLPGREITKLLVLFLPLVGVGFASYLFLLVEKVFLARLSMEAMEAAVNVAYVCHIFQGSTMALAMMAQVFVGRWVGSKEHQAIGPGVWQFIWFSFFSMIITVPGSLLYGKWYFQGTDIEKTALPYFYLHVWTGFLYPLGVVFTSFYLGQGKTRLVLVGNLGAQLIKVGMGYLLIFVGVVGFLFCRPGDQHRRRSRGILPSFRCGVLVFYSRRSLQLEKMAV